MIWRTILRMTLFVMAFTIKVTVKAEVIQEPKGCHNQAVTPCSYFIQSHHEVIQWNDHKFRLSKGTSFIRNAVGEYKLVNGEALIESEKELIMSTLYGKVKLEAGRALIKTGNRKTDFYSLAGVLKFQPRGMDEYTFLPVGFSNFVGRVLDTGIADTGYPKPAELDILLPLWAKFFTKSEKDILQAQMSVYREPWRVAVEQSGPWYVDTMKRQIAALEAERERKRRLRAAKLKEQNYFKEMFRRRNNL